MRYQEVLNNNNSLFSRFFKKSVVTMWSNFDHPKSNYLGSLVMKRAYPVSFLM